MTRTLWKLALGTSLAVLTFPTDIFAGRGGGRGGGGMQRGGGGGMQRGGGEGGMQRGGEGGGGMSHSPSFSQPRPQTGGSASGNRNPYGSNAGASGRNAGSSNPNAGAAAAENRNQSPNAGAAAGAGYANRNQPGVSNAGAAAAGAGYSNRNQGQYPNAGAAAGWHGYANRNQGQYPNAGAAAAGAGYANRNQNPYPNAGAAAAGAGYANRNQNPYPNAGAAAAGAAYANNNGYWNGNYGNGSLAAYGGMAMASPSYGYGAMPYMNPYAGMGVAAGGGGQPQPANAPAGDSQGYDYSQPVNAAAAPADVAPPADPSATPAAQARQAFQSGDYAGATRLTQQALGQMPNDVDLHQFLALDLFAQGNYEQAAAPLYAVLAVGPGWNWTTLIGNYPAADTYTAQLRGLEAYVKANPRSAQALFLLAYHYISQGQGEAAVRPLRNVVSLQPGDRVSAQLLEKLQPSGASAVEAQPLDPSRLMGVWTAQAPPNATITFSISDDTNFTWAIAAPGKPPVTIGGSYALADGVLTLSGKDAPGGPLAGRVSTPDDRHLTFRAVGAPASDPGLRFAR